MKYYTHPSAVIDPGAQIGEGTKVWHFSHIMSGSRIGARCTLGQNVFVADGVVIGDDVKIQNNVSLYTGVECERGVFVGPSVVFTNVTNPRSGVNRRGEYKKTHVRQGATLGANATVVCGVVIGTYAFVGAGAVVISDVADFALVVGNPSRQLGWMSCHGERLRFDAQGRAQCPLSGWTYVLEDGVVQCLQEDRSK